MNKLNYENMRVFSYLSLIFLISRIFYYEFFNIKFDGWTLDIYWQFFPKELLRNELIDSLIYNHYQPPFLNLLVGLLMKVSENYIFLLQLIYLFSGLSAIFFIYLICNQFQFSKNFSFIISSALLLLPTTILYENHLYKEYLTFLFVLWLFYFTLKSLNNGNSFYNIINISISLSLLCLTRETFHIFWGYILIFFIHKNFNFSKKITLLIIFTSIVSPFYIKNLILFNKFGINVSSVYEHLNQKIDYIKEMEDPERHQKIREFSFGSHKDYQNFKKKTSEIYDIPLYTSAFAYKDFFKHQYLYKNELLQSNTSFNEIWIEVNKYRKKDFLLILKEYPSLLLLNILNSATRHLFSSSDYFNFTKHNADKMKIIIKISDCLKLTPICFYEYKFDWKTGYTPDGQSFKTMDTGPLSYKEKIIYSLQYTNFLLIIIYLSLLYFLIKSFFSKRDKQENLINFWLITFIFIFLSLIIFEDGEIARHRFPFDYLCFLIFLKQIKEYFSKKKVLTKYK